MRRRLLSVVLSVLLVLGAGCAGFTGDGTEAETTVQETVATDSPETGTTTAPSTNTVATTATGTATTTPTATAADTGSDGQGDLATPGSDRELPSAVAANGSVDERQLFDDHLRAVYWGGWRMDVQVGNESAVFARTPNGTYRNSSGGEWWNRGTDAGRTEWWNRGNATVSRSPGIDGGEQYQSSYERNVSPPVYAYAYGGVTPGLQHRVGAGEYQWAGTTTVDGTRLQELVLTNTSDLAERYDHYTSRMLVDDDGRIHRLEGEQGPNTTAATQFEYDLSFPVETVPRPDWFESVPRVEAERVADDRLLAVTVTGGVPITNDGIVGFRGGGLSSNITLEDPLKPGETLYLGVTDDEDPSLVQSKERAVSTDLVDLSTRRALFTSFDETGNTTVLVTIVIDPV